MAPWGFRPCGFSRRNLFLGDHMENKLARDQGPANGSYLGSISPALSCNPTSGPALVPALISALVFALFSYDKLFK